MSQDNLSAFWMPFTANKAFKRQPKLFARAKGMYYYTEDGRQVLDGSAGLWCVNAGHERTKIVEAIQKQAATMSFCPSFQVSHMPAFELAERLTKLMPEPLNHLFYTNSGSEAVDSALKMALAYQQARGKGEKTRFVGREKGYHGVGFGGISVGGIGANRKQFGNMLTGIDHLPSIHNPEQTFVKGLQPQNDALADRLEEIIALHGANTIAAVIVEPVVGSGGAIIPPKGYLQRLRQICTKHDILLIFDEVITGFGRVGDAFAATHFDVTPDLMTMAKGINSGTVPMGAVAVSDFIHDTVVNATETGIEFFHGYTYSAHPMAVAAALATLDVYEAEGLFDKANQLASYWQEAIHSLKGLPHIVDIRNYGLIGALEFEPSAIAGQRGYDVFTEAFFNHDLLVRVSGDVIALSPPLVLEKNHIDELFTKLTSAIKAALA